MHRRLLLEELAVLIGLDKLDCILLSCRPVESMPERLADQCSELIMGTKNKSMNLLEQRLSFISEYALHQHTVEAFL